MQEADYIESVPSGSFYPVYQVQLSLIVHPNQADMLTWLIQSSAEGHEYSDKSIAMRMLNGNSVRCIPRRR